MATKSKKGKTNPNGANQFFLDPRQNMCWEAYVDPKSKTFGNGTQSALVAGYEPKYANQITTSEWFKVKLRKLKMLSKAERNLDQFMDMPVKALKMEGRGEDAVEVIETEPALVRIKLDASKFIAERLGKDDGYSTRNEVTGKDGGKVEIEVSKKKEIKKALSDI